MWMEMSTAPVLPPSCLHPVVYNAWDIKATRGRRAARLLLHSSNSLILTPNPKGHSTAQLPSPNAKHTNKTGAAKSLS